MRSRTAALVAVVFGVALSACSSSPSGTGFIKTGGTSGTATGGRSGNGGDSATGGSIGNSSGGAGVATGGGAGQDSSSGGTSQGGASGATGGAMGNAPVASEGCTKAPPTPTGMIGTTQYGKFTMTISAQSVLSFNSSPGQNQSVSRQYFVRLPNGYDRTKPYRVIYLGPGCGPAQDTQTTPKGFHLDTDPGSVGATTGAILVQMEQGTYNPAAYNPTNCQINNTTGCNATSAYCFDDWASEAGTPMVSSIPDGPSGTVAMEKAYFDALHKAVEANYCVDKTRQFYAGYSSGGWMAQQLGCWFPDVLRAQANVTGGIPPIIKSNADGANDYCVKHKIAAFLIHNNPDASNGFPGSVDAARRLYALNGCTGAMPGGTMGPPLPNSTVPLPAGLAPYTIGAVPNNASFRCYQFTTCPVDYPMVFCVSTDSGHQDQQARANPAFWEFFSKF